MCTEAPGLLIEKERLTKVIGGSFLGIIGDANHSFGYHLCNPSGGDYSTEGVQNSPVCPCACAIDIGMNWPAARSWLRWLIKEIREDRIKDIAEVIGSYDGRSVRYWSDASGWEEAGVPYDGTGHDTWTHVGIYRKSARQDHGILKSWTRTGYTGGRQMEQNDINTGNANRKNRNSDIWADQSNMRDEFYYPPGKHSLNPPPPGSRLDLLFQAVDKILKNPASGGVVDVAKLAEELKPYITAAVKETLEKTKLDVTD